MTPVSRTVDLNGPVHFLEYGTEGEVTFLCVHGLGGSHLNWTSIAPALARHGRVLAPDLAGFGRSPLAGRRPTVQGQRALVSRFIEAVAAGPVVLIGNSMGGAISIFHAAARPDHVAGLVLLGPACPRGAGGTIDPLVAAGFAAYMIPRLGERFVRERLRRLGPEGVVDETLRLCCADPARIDPAVVGALVDLLRERSEMMPWATPAYIEAARSVVRTVAAKRAYLDKVRAVRCPTLLLHGRHDRLVSLGSVRALAREREDWRFVVFDELGHLPQLEDPAATVEAIEAWLTENAEAIRAARTAREASG